MLSTRRARESRSPLPKGADAALWSIVEAVPDPRNHIALTRDLTGEVRIADLERMANELGLCLPARSSRSA